MFGSLVAERPGEYVAIDTTSLDVFAIDPFTFQWVGLDLTAAIDVCTRSILAFRLTPFSTQGVDLALLLSDLLSPTPVDGRWPADVPYPYCGVPENLVLRAFELPAGTPLAPRPTVRPGTVVIDRGRNYQSVAFMARVRAPADQRAVRPAVSRVGQGRDFILHLLGLMTWILDS